MSKHHVRRSLRVSPAFLLVALGVAPSFGRVHSQSVPPAADTCVAPATPTRFPAHDSLLVTPQLGFSVAAATGRYNLAVAVGDSVVTPAPTTIDLAPLSSADSAWAGELRKSDGRAPSLLGTSAELMSSRVRLPGSPGYVIVEAKGVVIQADVTPSGALIFALGDNLYGGWTIYQTTIRDDSVRWRGWWWHGSAHGYFCLTKQ